MKAKASVSRALRGRRASFCFVLPAFPPQGQRFSGLLQNESGSVVCYVLCLSRCHNATECLASLVPFSSEWESGLRRVALTMPYLFASVKPTLPGRPRYLIRPPRHRAAPVRSGLRWQNSLRIRQILQDFYLYDVCLNGQGAEIFLASTGLTCRGCSCAVDA